MWLLFIATVVAGNNRREYLDELMNTSTEGYLGSPLGTEIGVHPQGAWSSYVCGCALAAPLKVTERR